MAEERKWTEEQLRAIETRDRTLLVSAAAGSGKTATLTERIIRSLLDENEPENINEILVVTFTKAAASELRERIGGAIRAAIKKNPASERLQRQLALLPSAKIQTIDSFCVDILRKNCDRVGVSPSFRIPDEAEAQLLSASVMERLIDSIYEGLLPSVASPEELLELSDGLTGARSMDSLSEVLLSLYGSLRSTELGVETLSGLISEYNISSEEKLSSSKPIAYAIERARGMAEHYKALYERALGTLGARFDKNEKFIDMCEADTAYLEKIISARSYREVREALLADTRVEKKRLSSSSTDAMRFAVRVRCELDDDVEYFAENMFFLSPSEILMLAERLYGRLSVLYRLLSGFDREFMEEKRRLAICEFSDIERYTYQCLYDGAPTETARGEARRYSSIYIDEYQDVDAVQNRIFEAISRGGNRFMVGDIKQSIYGFRGAKPEIFANMKKSFAELDKSEPAADAALFMSKNFRSEGPIISFVNEVFDSLFALTGRSIGYRSEDRLEMGRADGKASYYPEIHILPKLSASIDETEEPRFVSKIVKQLTEEEGVSPSDIAILLRADRGRSGDFAEALSSLGVPAFVTGSRSFFLGEEVLLALCLLNSVDNPGKDIYLAGLMRSPLFNFSADELLKIRRGSRRQSLYGALAEYCEKNPDYARGVEFIRKLKAYRCISEGLPVDEVISRLYRETGLITLATEEGRRDLLLLYEYARSFEASSFKGLYNFIRYINDAIEGGVKLEEKKESSDSRAVKIVTAHSSKGLEYPTVILADAAKSMSKRESGRLMYADGFAISMTLRTESGMALLDNPINRIIADYKARRDFEEELRVLYVALTRAKERLYIVGTSTKMKLDEVRADLEFARETLTEYSVYKLPSYLISVLATASTTARARWHETVTEDTASQTEELESLPESEELSSEELTRRFSYEYPHEHLTRLPEKMAVSYLYPTVLDGNEEPPSYEFSGTGGAVYRKTSEKKGTLPLFMSGEDPDASAKRGIATHLFMQFCDLENFAANGASAELLRLTKEGFISETDAERVRLDEIELFLHSELLSQMRTAKKIYRELRFNVKLPASHFTTDSEKKMLYADKTVLVQGVIDCIIEREDGGLLLVDYKTDRLSDAELKNRALAAEKLTRSHASQLSYYKMAVEKMFGKPPVSVSVYSLPLGDTVEIKLEEK